MFQTIEKASLASAMLTETVKNEFGRPNNIPLAHTTVLTSLMLLGVCFDVERRALTPSRGRTMTAHGVRPFSRECLTCEATGFVASDAWATAHPLRVQFALLLKMCWTQSWPKNVARVQQSHPLRRSATYMTACASDALTGKVRLSEAPCPVQCKQNEIGACRGWCIIVATERTHSHVVDESHHIVSMEPSRWWPDGVEIGHRQSFDEDRESRVALLARGQASNGEEPSRDPRSSSKIIMPSSIHFRDLAVASLSDREPMLTDSQSDTAFFVVARAGVNPCVER